MRDFHIAAMLFGRLQLGTGAHLFHARLIQNSTRPRLDQLDRNAPTLLVEIVQQLVSGLRQAHRSAANLEEVAAGFF